jgi:hypothetical protein
MIPAWSLIQQSFIVPMGDKLPFCCCCCSFWFSRDTEKCYIVGKLLEEKGKWNKVLPFEIELKFDY